MDNMDQVNQGGDQDQQDQPSLGWRAALPDEFKEHDFVKDCQKPGDFVKRAIDTKTERDSLKTRLENSIPKLSDKATPEEVAAYNKAVGVPDKPDGYIFDKIEGLPIDENLVGKYKEVAHKLGIPANKANELYKWFNGEALEQAKALEAQGQKTQEQLDAETLKEKASAEAALKEQWGKDYEPNLEITRRLLSKFGSPELGEKFIKSGLGNDPAVISFLYQVASQFKDDTLADMMQTRVKDALKEGQLQFTYPSMER